MYKCDQLKAELLREIMTYKPHQKMHSRHVLCRKYNLARATVDKVLKELLDEGYLYAIKGSGTYVAPPGYGAARTSTDTQSWGVIVPNIANDICPQLVRGIEDVAQEHGINILICNADNKVKKESDYLHRMVRSGVAGLIVLPVISGMSKLEDFKFLQQRGIPLVFCHRGLDVCTETPLITSNDFYGSYIATRHLLKQGYERIAYISRYRYRTSMNRFYGYMAALQEVDREIYRQHICTQIQDAWEEGIQREIERMLSLAQPPDAFFCHNDEIALAVYNAVQRCGRRIGGEIGLVGYDNTNICEKVDVPITSVAYKSYEIGHKAAEVLYNLTQNRQPVGANIFMYQPELIVRNSSCRHGTQA